MINANPGDIDTTNDDVLEDNVDDHAVEPEESTEQTSEASDDEPSDDETVSLSRTELEKLRREAAAAKRLREKSKQGSEKGSDEGAAPQYDQELIERTFLAAQLGIQDPDVQDEAIRLAKKFGMNINQAVKDDDIKTRLSNLQKRKEAQRAVAKEAKGSAATNKGVEYWVSKFQRDGSLPDDPKLQSQVLDKLAG